MSRGKSKDHDPLTAPFDDLLSRLDSFTSRIPTNAEGREIAQALALHAEAVTLLGLSVQGLRVDVRDIYEDYTRGGFVRFRQ